jgi:23S rRNA pseudouridine2605 synthase
MEGSGERLQKVLAAAGIGSRRECEDYIRDGRVEVNGQVVRQLGVRVDPLVAEIRVDGVRLPRPDRFYYAVNKPPGVLSTNLDPAGRPRVIDIVGSPHRLFSVGRLDQSSEGLILLTNDGEFANRLAHPRYGVEKTYRVVVAGQPSRESLQRLLKGVHLAEGVARVAAVHVKKRYKQSTELEVVLDEGRNREIRRVLAHIGHKVMRLRRIAIGPLHLGELPTGAFRPLTSREIQMLLRATSGPRRRSKKKHERPVKAAQAQPRKSEEQRTAPPPPSTPPGDDEDWVEIHWEPSSKEGTILAFDEPTQGPRSRPRQRGAHAVRRRKPAFRRRKRPS